MDIETRIKRLEVASTAYVPGTMLTRALHPVSGIEWSLGIGPMGMPKHFFTGATIEEVLTKAETALNV